VDLIVPGVVVENRRVLHPLTDDHHEAGYVGPEVAPGFDNCVAVFQPFEQKLRQVLSPVIWARIVSDEFAEVIL
jgi:hypothetical protein